jgi:SAM-dependent methyltransferase
VTPRLTLAVPDQSAHFSDVTAATEMTDYYARRAQEYEAIYAKPERQADLAALRIRLPALLAGRHVYEVACGTGYWTQFVAQEAASVFATDYNEEVLAIARTKTLPPGRVTFARGDAFAPPPAPVACDGALAAFWWSHVRRGAQTEATVALARARTTLIGIGAQLALAGLVRSGGARRGLVVGLAKLGHRERRLGLGLGEGRLDGSGEVD